MLYVFMSLALKNFRKGLREKGEALQSSMNRIRLYTLTPEIRTPLIRALSQDRLAMSHNQYNNYATAICMLLAVP